MNTTQKNELKKKILSRYELYELQGSRFRRFLKDPIRTLSYFIMQFLAYRRPYKVTYTTLWGDTMRFYLPEGGAVYYYGFFEANLSNFFVNFLNEGDTFFDIGAHVGFYSMLASSLVGDKGKVIGFEPTPRTFESLSENAKNKKNIEVYNNAVLDSEKTIEFFDYGPKYSAFNTFQKRTSEDIFFKDNVKAISVKTIAIDHFCKEKGLSPTLIKIDAEGSEYLILRAMTNLLNEHHPFVTIEVSTVKEWKENLEESITIFEKHNYHAYTITIDGLLELCDPRKPRLYDNLLFVHPSKRERIQNILVKK